MLASVFRSLRPLFPERLRAWLGPLLVVAAVSALGGMAVLITGAFNVSAVRPHPAGWARLLHFASDRSIAAHARAPRSEFALDDPALILCGAAEYASVCQHCHGGPGLGQSPTALSLRPEPPMLVDGPEWTRSLTDEEKYFSIQNGLRYTGMPAWPVLDRPDEVWALVAFLNAAQSMDRRTYERLVRGPIAESSGTERKASGCCGSEPQNEVAAAALDRAVPQTGAPPEFPGQPQSLFAVPAATALPRAPFGRELPEDVSNLCSNCHGVDGTGRPGGPFPNLTLQTPQYLYDALTAFAQGRRHSGVMWGIASSLADDQMRALAERYGRGKPRPSAGESRTPTVSADVFELGRRVWNGDLPARKVATADATHRLVACASCHAYSNDAYVGKVIPAVRSQQRFYLRAQLYAFRRGGRGDTLSYDPMVDESHGLADAEIEAVSMYLSTSAPDEKGER